MSRSGRALGGGSLKLVKRGRGPALWVLDYCDASGRRQRKALAPDKRTAERMRAELVQQRDLGLAGLSTVEGQARPLAEIKRLYLEDLGHRVCESQLVNVTSRLERLLPQLRARRVRDLQPAELLTIQSQLLRSGLSHRTVNVTLGGLKAMLNWAVCAGLIAENPIARLKPLPCGEQYQRHRRRALTEEEVGRFLAAAAEDDRAQAAYRGAEATIASGTKSAAYADQRRLPRVPQRLLWRTLVEAGSRWGETTRSTWADLNVVEATLRLRAETTKSGRTRMIPLHADLVAALIELRTAHQRARERVVQPGDRIFLTPDGCDLPRDTAGARRIFHRILELAGIPRRDATGGVFDIHALRHTAATRMARHGVPLTVAQRVLGHADPALTARVYTHLEVDDLRQAVIEPGKSRSATA